MPKKPRVRTLMDSQHVKGSETLLKSARQYFCHFSGSFRKKIISKNSFLVVSEILRLFVNILTPDERYCLSVKTSVSRNQFKSKYLQIKKKISNFFCICEIYIKFGILSKKRCASEVICFWNYTLQKVGLLKCLKSPISERL